MGDSLCRAVVVGHCPSYGKESKKETEGFATPAAAVGEVGEDP